MAYMPISGHVCKKVMVMVIIGEILVVSMLYYSGYTFSSAIRMVYQHNVTSSHTPSSQPSFSNSTLVRNSGIHVDIHLEGSDHQHTFQEELLVNSSKSTLIYKAVVSIGMGLTTRGLRNINSSNLEKKMPFFKSFLPSFCRTASGGYLYPIFIAHDYDDINFVKKDFLYAFSYKLSKFVENNCPKDMNVSLHFVVCSHHKKPAWAQNDAMIEAYLSGSDYFYRINDDTIMETKGWTARFISTLSAFSPSLVGVTGPKHKGGNTAILTYDFTHRTHVEVFGFYYPREFPDWYGDRWITDVYKPGRSIKLQEVSLRHTMESGQRYSRTANGHLLKAQLEKDRATMKRYVSSKEKGFIQPDPKKVISLGLVSNDSAQMWGAVRNAQLLPVIYPGWTLRIYIPSVSAHQESPNIIQPNMTLPKNIRNTLLRLGAQIIQVNVSSVPVGALNLLVTDDPTVDVFLIRESNSRFHEREEGAVAVWLKQNPESSNVLHSMRDHQSHKDHNIVTGTWGARSEPFRKLLGKGVTMKILIQDYYKVSVPEDKSFSQSFLDNILWDKVKSSVLCHDSITCEREVHGVAPFPVLRAGNVYVGQKYDGHEQPLDSKKDLSLLYNRTTSCDGVSQ